MGKRTTDEIRRTQIRYLGPRSLTLPFHLTFVQWGIYIGFALPLGLAGLVLLGPYWFGMGAGTGIGIAFFVARAVSPDRAGLWRCFIPLVTPQIAGITWFEAPLADVMSYLVGMHGDYRDSSAVA